MEATVTEHVDIIVDDDGRWIVADTGEIVALPNEDIVALAAHRLKDGKDQIKAWERENAINQSALLKYAPVRVEFTDFTIARQQGSRPVQDVEAIARECVAMAEDTWADDAQGFVEALHALLASATGFKDPPDWARDIVAENTQKVPLSAFIRVSAKRKDAPVRKRVES